MTQQRVTATLAGLERAAAAAGVPPDQGRVMWEALVAESLAADGPDSTPTSAAAPRLGAEGVFYYIGGLIVVGAMALFLGLAGSTYGAGALLATALAYLALFVLAAEYLHTRRRLVVPGGLLATAAAVCVPIALYGLGGLLGMWEEEGWSSTFDAVRHVKALALWSSFLAASTVALVRYPFGFGIVPMLVAASAMAAEVATLAAGHELHDDAIGWLALLGGITMVAGAVAVDRRTEHDYAMWTYLAGASLMALGVAFLLYPWEGSVLHGAAWVGVSVAALAFGIVVQRQVFLVYGGVGLFAYIGYVAWEAFEDSLLLPFALTAVGLLVIAAGVWYQRRQEAIEAWLVRMLPEAVTANLPHNR